MSRSRRMLHGPRIVNSARRHNTKANGFGKAGRIFPRIFQPASIEGFVSRPGSPCDKTLSVVPEESPAGADESYEGPSLAFSRNCEVVTAKPQQRVAVLLLLPV